MFRVATKWILDYTEIGYKERLTILRLLPLSLYGELHDILLIDVMSDKYDFCWDGRLSFRNSVGTRSASTVLVDIERSRTAKSRQNFWWRSSRLANLLPSSLDMFDRVGLKKRLTTFYQQYFTREYDETRPCTWKVQCLCVNCSSTTIQLPRSTTI